MGVGSPDYGIIRVINDFRERSSKHYELLKREPISVDYYSSGRNGNAKTSYIIDHVGIDFFTHGRRDCDKDKFKMDLIATAELLSDEGIKLVVPGYVPNQKSQLKIFAA